MVYSLYTAAQDVYGFELQFIAQLNQTNGVIRSMAFVTRRNQEKIGFDMSLLACRHTTNEHTKEKSPFNDTVSARCIHFSFAFSFGRDTAHCG